MHLLVLPYLNLRAFIASKIRHLRLASILVVFIVFKFGGEPFIPN